MAYIYALTDPRVADPIKRIRYIGKTDKAILERYQRHLKSVKLGSRFHCHNWMRQLAVLGFSAGAELLEEVTVAEASDKERRIIAIYRAAGAPLTNHTDGGDGVSGLKFSDAALERMSVSHRGKIIPLEQRTRMADGNRRAWADPSVGKRRRDALLAALIGKPCSRETRRKISDAQKGRIVSTERRSAIAQSLRGRKQSEETKRKRSETLKRVFADPAIKEKLSQAHLKTWRDPEFREKMRIAVARRIAK